MFQRYYFPQFLSKNLTFHEKSLYKEKAKSKLKILILGDTNFLKIFYLDCSWSCLSNIQNEKTNSQYKHFTMRNTTRQAFNNYYKKQNSFILETRFRRNAILETKNKILNL